MTGEKRVLTRVCDLQHAVSAVTGKVELVLEGEQEGALNVARALLGRGVKALFSQRFPDAFKPRRTRRGASVGAPRREAAKATRRTPSTARCSNGSRAAITSSSRTTCRRRSTQAAARR